MVKREKNLYNMYENCAFSGHRKVGTDLDKKLFARVVENLIIHKETKNFYCGMAMGFDLIAAETVIKLKKKYNVKLIACVPYIGQSNAFSATDKKKYERVLKKCDEVIVLSQNYYNGCLHYRDRYMVDKSDVLISFLRENKGGTYYTVNYAKKNNVPVIEV